MQYCLIQGIFSVETYISEKGYGKDCRKYSKDSPPFIYFEGGHFQHLLQHAISHSLYYTQELKTVNFP